MVGILNLVCYLVLGLYREVVGRGVDDGGFEESCVRWLFAYVRFGEI